MGKFSHCIVFIGCIMSFVFVGKSIECPTQVCKCDAVKKEVSCQNVNDGNLKYIASNVNGTTVYLTLEGNLTTLGSYFRITSLKVLTLKNNKFTGIPRNMSLMFQNLTNLFLNGNQIEAINAEDFDGMNELQKIELNENMLGTLSDGVFESLGNLKQLHIDKNRIKSMSKDSFKGLTQLQVLSLKENQISNLIPGVFNHFDAQSINKIWLSNNKIEILPNNLFDSLHKMSELDLSNNKISLIGKSAFQNTAIEIIILDGNNLTTLLSSSFQNITTEYFSIADNPIFCDCGIANFLITANEVEFIGTCQEPKEFSRKRLMDFTKNITTPYTALETKGLLCTSCELNNTCLNNAECIPVNRTGISCDCVDDYLGESCELPPVCLNSPCKNDGVCLSTGKNTYKCECTDAYKGEHCEEGSMKLLIAIVVGVVGFILLLIVIAILVLLKRRPYNQREKVAGDEVNIEKL